MDEARALVTEAPEVLGAQEESPEQPAALVMIGTGTSATGGDVCAIDGTGC